MNIKSLGNWVAGVMCSLLLLATPAQAEEAESSSMLDSLSEKSADWFEQGKSAVKQGLEKGSELAGKGYEAGKEALSDGAEGTGRVIRDGYERGKDAAKEGYDSGKDKVKDVLD